MPTHPRSSGRLLSTAPGLHSLLRVLCCALLCLHASLWAAGATESLSIPVTATVAASPPRITLEWTLRDATSTVGIDRRVLGSAGWNDPPLATLPARTTAWSDTTAVAGVAYEYRITHASGMSYIASGIDLPVPDRRGAMVLLIDERFQLPLQAELAQLQADLVGEGWSPLVHLVSPFQSVASVKALVVADAALHADLGSILIIGHVPVPYGGSWGPDGHSDHRGAWPADIFYGDLDGDYTDSVVDVTNANRGDPGRCQNDNVPGDGRFDQDDVTGTRIIPVGRVDLFGMPAFAKSEVELQRQYWQRDHAWRIGATPALARSLVDDNFPDGYGLSLGSWQTVPLVGKGNVVQGDWFAPTQPWLFAGGYGFGKGWEPLGVGGSFEMVLGAVDTNALTTRKSMGVFTMMMASWVGDWNTGNNVMRAVLANDGYGLTCVYSGRPVFAFHGMGIGRTIGESVLMSQDPRFIGDHQSWYQGSRQVALLGDPSLRLYPVRPPGVPTAITTGSNVALSWAPSPDATAGYLVYRSLGAGAAIRLTAQPISATTFTDTGVGAGSYRYAVRAIERRTSPSGTFLNDSVGRVALTAVAGTTAKPVLALGRGLVGVANHGSDAVGQLPLGVPTRLSYTVTNAGSGTLSLAALEIVSANGCSVAHAGLPASLAAGVSTSVDLIVTPGSPAWDLVASIANNDPERAPFRWSVGGTALAAEPVLRVVRDDRVIANGAVDGFDYSPGRFLVYTLMNTGSTKLAMSISTDQLANCTTTLITLPPSDLAPGGSAALGLLVTPTTSGAWSFRLGISSNAKPASCAWTVQGSAVVPPGPELLVKRGTSVIANGMMDRHSGAIAGQPHRMTYTIANTGTTALAFSDLEVFTPNQISNCAVAILAQPGGTVAAGQSADLTILVSPQEVGGWAFIVRFSSNDADEGTCTWSVRGYAEPRPEVEVSRQGLVVGNGATDAIAGTVAGNPQAVDYMINNVGTSSLRVTLPVVIAGQSNCSVTIATMPAAAVVAKSKTPLGLVVTATAAGPWRCTVSFGSDDSDENPVTWTITGVAGAPRTGTGEILREYWTGMPGNGIADLTGHSAYPLRPTGRGPLTSLESVSWVDGVRTHELAEQYGERIRGYITAPATGAYTFWISGDDQCELRLGTDEDPAHARVISAVSSYTGFREWNKLAAQRSSPITMEMGRRYYVEVLHKEGIGLDSCSVGWLKPGEAGSQPSGIVPGSALSPFIPTAIGAVLREYWLGVPGSSLADLMAQADYPFFPTGSDALTSLESVAWYDPRSRQNFADAYGERIRGYITAPETGGYRFWLSGDNACELRLSSDEDPAHAVRIVGFEGYTGFREWNRNPQGATQVSQRIDLVLGRRYYVEVLHKEGTGGDSASVGWSTPGQATTAPSGIVPGSVLSPFTPPLPPGLSAAN